METDRDRDEPFVVPIEDSIDLHTFRPSEVESVVEEYLAAADRSGFPMVRIIHGRGIGVQREIVRSVLKRHPSVLGYSDAPDRGATLVRLAKPAQGPREGAPGSTGNPT
jgi:DNA-nicking Smr family endonuclease